jgi:hypothetical protein
MIFNYIMRASAFENLRTNLLHSLGATIFSSLLSNMQYPLFFIAFDLIGFLLIILFWILLPYWLGRNIGGHCSFSSFAYNSSLFIAPINVISSLVSLVFSGVVGFLYLILSLFLEVFRAYLVYANLQATMKLPKRKSALIALSPIALAIILFCGFSTFVLLAPLSR